MQTGGCFYYFKPKINIYITTVPERISRDAASCFQWVPDNSKIIKLQGIRTNKNTMSINVKFLTALHWLPFYWCFKVHSMTLNMDVKNPTTYKKIRAAISCMLWKGNYRNIFAQLTKMWSNVNDNTLAYEWLTEFYCVHHNIKYFQNPSSIFSPALCALAIKSQLNPPIPVQNLGIYQQNIQVPSSGSIRKLWRPQALQTSLELWARSPAGTPALHLLGFVPEHTPPFSKPWSWSLIQVCMKFQDPKSTLSRRPSSKE